MNSVAAHFIADRLLSDAPTGGFERGKPPPANGEASDLQAYLDRMRAKKLTAASRHALDQLEALCIVAKEAKEESGTDTH